MEIIREFSKNFLAYSLCTCYNIIDVFDKVQESDFLKGNNDRGWKANIDFILREDKFVSILEGKYNNTRKKKKTIDGLEVTPKAKKGEENGRIYHF